MKRKLIAAGAAVAALGAAGAGAALAFGGGDDGDNGLTGREANRAAAAALSATGGGTVNAAERDAEDGATYEVEVQRTDGSTVDVRLDARYRLIVIEPDSEQSDSGD
jgi:hypothetical protein